MRSPKKRLSMLYWVQTWRSSVGMFWTMSSAVAQMMYLAVLACASAMPAERMSVSKNLIAVGDLLHQAGEGGAQQRDAQAAEQQQQRPGRAHDRVVVGRDQFVEPRARALRWPARPAAAPDAA